MEMYLDLDPIDFRASDSPLHGSHLMITCFNTCQYLYSPWWQAL